MFSGNLDQITAIKNQFETDMTAFCPANGDRENQSNPECYCYTSGSNRNPLRVNSDICKAYWGGFDASFYAGIGDYNYTGPENIKGCVDMKGNFDVNCNCRKFMDRSSGQNACFKTNNSFPGIGNIGNSTTAGVLTNYANQMASDPATIHRLNGDLVAKNAIMAKNAADQVLLGFNKQRASMGQKPFLVGPQQVKDFVNKMMSLPGTREALASVKETMALPPHPPLVLPKSFKLKGEKKLDLSKITYEPMKRPKEKAKAKKKKGPLWDLLTHEEKKEKDDYTFMKKTYDMTSGRKKDDIVRREDVNIFTIISDRYIRTGLKLLFRDTK
jgi:hypothetical protein